MATRETLNPDILSSQPEDIIYNIFFRLPIKTLLQLKSVCRSWLSVISSPEFVKTHLSVSANDHRLIIFDRSYDDHLNEKWLYLLTRPVYSLGHEPFTETFQCNDDPRFDSVVGYCNGLALVKDWHHYNQLYLWNPSTKASRKLPRLEWICSSTDTKYGFGYDESDDDFKIFAVSPAHYHNGYEFEDPRSNYCEYKVSVYSLRGDFWRFIGDFPYRLVVHQHDWAPEFVDGEFANGSIYWLITPELQNKIILSFDIKSETYQEVPHPNFGDDIYSWTLGTSGKSLSILSKSKNTCADFWMMNQCGVEVSWTKLFTIPYGPDQLITSGYGLKPICISTNGEIILKLGSTTVLYNWKEKKVKDMLADHHFDLLDVYAFADSLVSPYI